MATSADIQSYNSELDAFEQYHQQREQDYTPQPKSLPALGHGIAGAFGGAVSNVAIYPLNLMITRSQQKKKKGAAEESVFDAARKIYENEGLAGFYAGCLIDSTKTMADNFLFFMAYNAIRQSRLHAHGGRKNLPVLDELSVGFVAGVFSKFFTAPLSNIVVRLQTSAGSQKATVSSVIADIREEKGILGFWSGYSAQFVTTLNPSLTFFIFEFLKKTTLSKEKRAEPPAFATFLLSALSKAAANASTYPFTLAKSRAQAKSNDPLSDEEKAELRAADDPMEAAIARGKMMARRTIFGTVAEIARNDGLPALYQGLELEILKGFLSHGLTMVIKESIHKVILQLYWLLLKMTRGMPSPQEAASNAIRKIYPDGGNTGEFASSVFDEVKDRTESTLEYAADASRATVDATGLNGKGSKDD